MNINGMVIMKLACAAGNRHDLLFHLKTGKLKTLIILTTVFFFLCLFIILCLNKHFF